MLHWVVVQLDRRSVQRLRIQAEEIDNLSLVFWIEQYTYLVTLHRLN